MSNVKGLRKQVYTALFDLVKSAAWGTGQHFLFSSRRIKHPKDITSSMQPCLFQEVPKNNVTQVTGQPYKQKWFVKLLICHQAGLDPAAIPSDTNDEIIDAIFETLKPKGFYEDKQTLGGLVHHCFIDGTIEALDGALDGQALIFIPITILVP